MTDRDVGRDFDKVSVVYDETRQPLDAETIGGFERFLHEHAWTSILEVGVGTGRILRPLAERGFRAFGVDVSQGMLARASTKGLPFLVRATAYHLPFRDRSLDAVLFAHVLHLLDDPAAGLREAARVSRGGILAIMDRPNERPEKDTPRAIVGRILAEEGFPEVLRPGPLSKEREILAAHPPKEVRTLSDRDVTEPLSEQLDRIEKRAYRHVLDVPPDVLDRAVAAARARVGDRTVTYRRTEAVVWWPPVE
ncbi:MAG TPA: class I SAM-dependent methyltransferase [Thermoplasmata archaeon]|nr:class I SAM-dependent methyltransferase [Thermoplasmata archaeon]